MSDNEMVEQCVKALDLAIENFKNTSEVGSLFDLSNVVLVVIKAMREPTGKMITAALNDYIYREKTKQPWNAKFMWSAMIYSILND